MTRRVNHRGWIVLESFADSSGRLCVDLFEDPDGSFGFEQLRADPEDGGRWSAVGGFSAARFSTLAGAGEAATVAVRWLHADGSTTPPFGIWLAGVTAAHSPDPTAG